MHKSMYTRGSRGAELQCLIVNTTVVGSQIYEIETYETRRGPY